MDPAPLPEACSYSTFTSLQDGRALLFGGNNGSQSFNDGSSGMYGSSFNFVPEMCIVKSKHKYFIIHIYNSQQYTQ